MCLRAKARMYEDRETPDQEIAVALQEAFERTSFADENIEEVEYTEKLYSTPRITVWLNEVSPDMETRASLPSGVDLVVRKY